MAGKTTDRKGKGKETKQALINEPAAFVLPCSLPCSEIDFPIIPKQTLTTSWQQILEESKQRHTEIEEFETGKTELVPKSPFLKTECDYIKNKVFVYLLPALEETLNKAKTWDALNKEQCFFNGIDHIVQFLWNNNPRHQYRSTENLHVFNMPWVRQYLKTHPRPYYPKSWLWTEEYAATMIQKTVRQYFVQREEDVQEMRDFWRKLELEREMPEIVTNPFLAKKFASERHFKKLGSFKDQKP